MPWILFTTQTFSAKKAQDKGITKECYYFLNFFLTFKWKEAAKSFSIYETKWAFYPDGCRATFRIYKFPNLLYNSPISCCDICVFRYTAVFFNWLFSFSAPSTKTTYVSYTNHAIWLHILKMVWHGSDRTGSNDWNPSMRHQCCLWTRGWTLGLFFFLGYFL